MINIETPLNYTQERKYILDVIFVTFLGIEYDLKQVDRDDVLIFINSDEVKLSLPDVFFSTPETSWLNEESLPKQPLKSWNSTVVIYGELNEENSRDSYIPIDIFGSAFFMLTRYEEIAKKDRDVHGRFPMSASLAFQEGFLERPIINEYLEILWLSMKRLWPELKRKKRDCRMLLTHDVDSPFLYAFLSTKTILRMFFGDIVKRKSSTLAIKNFSNWMKVKLGNLNADPCNTFDFIMDLSEKANLKSVFYFMTDATNTKTDGHYDIDNKQIRALIRKIHKRGHEIGLHPSYHTYCSYDQLKKEFDKLIKVCSEEGVQQAEWGGRQHYLRWKNPDTFQNWNDAGLHYDSTLGYAGHAGFRCGTCYEFPVFNLKTRKKLKLIERPLIFMEVSILDEKYMNMGTGDLAYEKIESLINLCKKYSGDFTLLWHNSQLFRDDDILLYKRILKSVAI